MLTGGSGTDAATVGLADAEHELEVAVQFAIDAGFDATGLRIEAERKTAEHIVQVAEEQDAPLIVMGQRGRSGLKVAMLGSVSRDVTSAFHRPVLLIGDARADG